MNCNLFLRFKKITTDYMSQMNYVLNFVTALLLCFYLNMCIRRWWSIRDNCLGNLWSSLSNLVQITSTHLIHNEDEQYVHLLVRYCLLTHALMYKQANNTDLNLTDLLHMKLITAKEIEYLDEMGILR